MGLHADVFGRVAAADQEQILAGETFGAAEVVGVQDLAGEAVDTRKFGDIGGGEVTRGHHELVKDVVSGGAGGEILHSQREFLGVLVPGGVASHGVELNIFAHIRLLNPALDVVKEDLAGRERGNGAAKVLVERVIGKL